MFEKLIPIVHKTDLFSAGHAELLDKPLISKLLLPRLVFHLMQTILTKAARLQKSRHGVGQDPHVGDAIIFSRFFQTILKEHKLR